MANGLTPMPFLPELLLLFAIYCFLALGLISVLCEKLFPAAFPYLCHITALIGYGQLWINYSFLGSSIDARFWTSLMYLLFTAALTTAVTLYIAVAKRRLAVAGMFLGGVNVPMFSAAAFIVSCYVNGISLPMPKLPVIPVETIQTAIAMSMVLVGLSAVVFVGPERLMKISARAVKHPTMPSAKAGSLTESLATLNGSFERGEIGVKEYLEQRKKIVNSSIREKTWLEDFEGRLEGLGEKRGGKLEKDKLKGGGKRNGEKNE